MKKLLLVCLLLSTVLLVECSEEWGNCLGVNKEVVKNLAYTYAGTSAIMQIGGVTLYYCAFFDSSMDSENNKFNFLANVNLAINLIPMVCTITSFVYYKVANGYCSKPKKEYEAV